MFNKKIQLIGLPRSGSSYFADAINNMIVAIAINNMIVAITSKSYLLYYGNQSMMGQLKKLTITMQQLKITMFL